MDGASLFAVIILLMLFGPSNIKWEYIIIGIIAYSLGKSYIDRAYPKANTSSAVHYSED